MAASPFAPPCVDVQSKPVHTQEEMWRMMAKNFPNDPAAPEGYLWFYSNKKAPFACFSNFSAHEVVIDGMMFPTTEHYFQAMKFEGHPDVFHQVRQADSPMKAAQMGRDRRLPLRRDWESVKVDIMRKAIAAKFTTHADCKRTLLATAGYFLVEHTSNDRTWGDSGCPDWRVGRDDTNAGTNYLGRLLTELREQMLAAGEVPARLG